VGSVAKFRFGKGGGPDMEIVALFPNKFVHWLCRANSWGDEWINTDLTFEIEPQGAKTMVRFSHRRWMTESDFMRSCSLKWATFLLSLKSFVERGKGAPAPDDLET
jgi:Activator of Hsp90 ATPase homolog 1-like protein